MSATPDPTELPLALELLVLAICAGILIPSAIAAYWCIRYGAGSRVPKPPPRLRPKPKPRPGSDVKADLAEIHKRLNALADLGLTVSICYGESAGHGRIYSVDVLDPSWRSFAKPFGAESLEQAIEIAEIEGPKLLNENPKGRRAILSR